jgi:hypothetical protein
LRGADCDTACNLVIAKDRERSTVSKQAPQKMDMDRPNLKKLYEGEVKEEYQVTNIKQFCSSGLRLNYSGWRTK